MFGDGVGKLGWAAATADCVMGITDGEAGRAEQIYSEDGRSAASRAVSQAGSQGTPGRNTRTSSGDHSDYYLRFLPGQGAYDKY